MGTDLILMAAARVKIIVGDVKRIRGSIARQLSFREKEKVRKVRS